MKNCVFPDEDVTENDLYYLCFMIEKTARTLRQHNRYVVNQIDATEWRRLISIANMLHCDNPDKVCAEWIEEYHLEMGNFDITITDPWLEVHVPFPTQMGRVYKRLILATMQPGEDYVDGLIRVYNDPICDTIDNYNCSAFYEPSYVIARAYNEGGF